MAGNRLQIAVIPGDGIAAAVARRRDRSACAPERLLSVRPFSVTMTKRDRTAAPVSAN
ncbi:conserved hypothetical protein [Chelatococcus asaccharovorans]|uniref:Uncharacterized protein n=1 Tax=Chelatococcus asaccharovorans TaxID=28210 RepID=A0A2V3UEQ1_9HYPH|nr:hypothetical protein [Chelatococcus asaccharovorans]MBS7707348.1 hypothetical protein [Chelatococcus asaccharovorans]PXW63530.1 hypothetical protein C7450_102446 [Chelatococcus asaccharovorans]CAH1650785.1 conserved hypothetical protein [Chelatococcus asaccharovorans]CAH1692535.1 conserved hypothetical protein [Chelatococcus asaccharovorans]